MGQYQTQLQTVKNKMKATWEDGDYATFATYMEAGAIDILHSWPLDPGQRLLDIACGSGQTAIPAARKGLEVTGVDIAENLVRHACQRSADAGLEACFKVGDAERLPCDIDSFDVIITMFGAMFAPRPKRVVDECARVLRPGGTLIMANWTTTSMPAQMFKCVSAYVPPPPGVTPPVLWGDENTVVERLEPFFTDIRLNRRFYPHWHYPCTATELVDFFRAYFGPVKRAFDNIDAQAQQQLHRQLTEIYECNSKYRPSDKGDTGTLTITGGEFLEVIATRR